MIINKDTIIVDPNPLLREKSSEVKLPLSEEDRALLTDMLEYVRKSQDDEIAEAENLLPAVGIAAPQVGVLKQMSAIVVHDMDDEGNITKTHEYALVNPKIVEYSKREAALSGGEGCLSIREEHQGYVYRPSRIKVVAYDMIVDEMVEIKVSGYLSIVFQHEIDHLKGILFYDHIQKDNPWLEKEKAIIL